jgi:hypothetical protein
VVLEFELTVSHLLRQVIYRLSQAPNPKILAFKSLMFFYQLG